MQRRSSCTREDEREGADQLRDERTLERPAHGITAAILIAYRAK
jgi:hypothetical protein